MKNLKILLLLFLSALFILRSLAGQSNMNRFGYNKDLPNDPWNYDSAGYSDLGKTLPTKYLD